jgi:3-isopropylmalate dehydrogenase
MSAKILVLPGDGIGPEIVSATLTVLDRLRSEFGFAAEVEQALVGGAAYDDSGSPLPEATMKLAKAADAVLLGAVGGPRWDSLAPELRPEKGLLGLRSGLGLFANLRPALLYPQLAGASTLRPEVVADLDLLIVRELTGDIYFGKPRWRTANARATTPWSTAKARSGASAVSPSNPRASATGASARWTRPMCWKPRGCGVKS